MQLGNWPGRSCAGEARTPYTSAAPARMIPAGKTGDMPVGQSRPLDTPFARVRNEPLLAWALSQGLIEVNADGSWHLTEAALEWLRHQPLKKGNPVAPPLRNLPSPDRYDA
jgi:hypothetical protein